VQLPPITIDFEAYYDKQYTLSKLNVVNYVRDSRFEVIGFSWQEEGQEAQWFSGGFHATKAKLLSLELHRRMVTAHNVMFDGSIIEWVFDIRPRRYFCTMMAARPFVVPFTGSASLATCAEFFELPRKTDAVRKMVGLHRTDFSADLLTEYSEYCINDTAISTMLREVLASRLPKDEQDVIDLTLKKFLRGRLLLDRGVLEEAQKELQIREANALLKVSAMGVTREQLVSNDQFAALLRLQNVPIPMKKSPSTGQSTYAFSKKDPEFMELLKHDNHKAAWLVESRLILKSSIDRTRVQTYLDIERVCPTLPVPLMYYAAHTGRFGGMMGLNVQNLPQKGALRNALRAPPGFKVVVADLKAIEARITAVLADEVDLVRKFREGVDVYTDFASALYVKSAAEINSSERFVGKMCILGLGFGMGPTKFKDTMDSLGVPISETRATEIVAVYRSLYPNIKKLWRKLDGILEKMVSILPNGGSVWHRFPGGGLNPPLRVTHQRIELPNSMCINYPELGIAQGSNGNYTYRSFHGKGLSKWSHIWGGALCENIVQALARIILVRAEVRLARTGLVSVMQVHDELVFVVPEHTVEAVKSVITRILTDPVPWMPGLPLACTLGSGDSYGECK
jgi:DNA polymerase